MTKEDQLQFTSPLSVLLDLIEKEHLDITEISLSKITGQYFSFLKKLEYVSAPILADFLTIASRLVLLKSQSLTSFTEDEEELEEPLLEQLRLYREFRIVAKALGELAKNNGPSYDHTIRWDEFTTFSMPPNLIPNQLHSAIQQVLEDITTWDILPEASIHDRISIGEKIDELKALLQKQATFALHEKTSDAKDPLHLLIEFLAVLEMVHQQKVRATQASFMGPITIQSTIHE